MTLNLWLKIFKESLQGVHFDFDTPIGTTVLKHHM